MAATVAGALLSGLIIPSLLIGAWTLHPGDATVYALGALCLAVAAGQLLLTWRLLRALRHGDDARRCHAQLETLTRQLRADAADSAAHFQAVTDSLDVAITVYDKDFRLKSWNEAMIEKGMAPADMVRPGARMRDLIYVNALRGLYGAVDSADEVTNAVIAGIEATYRQGGDAWSVEFADGRRFNIHNRVLANGDMVVCSVDVTDLHEAMDSALREVSRQCSLTGLINRTGLRADLEAMLTGLSSSQARAAVLAIDLERFRSLNSSLGPDAGDKVLCTVADRLRARAEEDDLLARVSADEFVVAFSGEFGVQDVEARTEALIRALEAPMEVDGHSVTLGVRVGMAVYPDHAPTFDHLLAKAAIALKAAKGSGQGRFCLFDEDLSGADEEHNNLRLEISRALAEKEFMIYYQPQLDLKTGKVIGAETLIRWLHPKFGWVTPAKFIPVAESSQQIVQLTEWLLPAACREAKRWIGRGWTDLVVSVNISPVHFHAGNLVELVHHSLVESGLPAQNLELEVTEGILLPDAEHVADILRALAELGVRLAVDDFGTGYSAMSYLRAFPFSKLKIDSSFVREIGASAEARSIVEAIVQLGHSLGHYVLAEGVETAEQEAALAEIGCNGVQGFLHSKALPADHFVTWMQTRKVRSPSARPGAAKSPRKVRA